jgi:multidrug efflux system outer membrane protein
MSIRGLPVSEVKRTAIMLGLTVALSGCINLAPRYERPQSPVDAEWHAPADTPGAQTAEGNAAAALQWEQFFQSEKLRQLVGLALQNNRDLRVATLNVERAQALYRVQRADRFPSISANGSMDRGRMPADISPAGGRVTETYSASVGAAFELDLFGRVHNLSRAALEDYFAQQSTQRSVRISLISQIARTYLMLANEQALHQLALDTQKNQAEWFSLTEQRHRLGAVSQLQLSQAETTVENARVDVARTEGNIAQDINALNVLVGSTVPSELLPTAQDAREQFLSQIPVGLPSEVLLERPDILAAEHALRAANANIGAARAAFFPSISLTGSTGYISNELSGLFDSDNRTWSFTPGISLPIFQGGRLAANAAAARVERDIALARYEQSIQTGFREVSDALALSDSLARQRAAQQRLVNAAAKVFELSQARKEMGQDSYLLVLDAQRNHYAAEQVLIATRLREFSNLVSLYEALGGGQDLSAP